MPKYLVSHTETNIYSIEVEADSEQEAEEVAEWTWENSEDLFRHSDTTDSFFQVGGEV